MERRTFIKFAGMAAFALPSIGRAAQEVSVADFGRIASPSPVTGGPIFSITDFPSQEAIVKVLGIGNYGGKTVDYMIAKGVKGVEFICANTDIHALNRSLAATHLQLGPQISKGLGARTNPEIGRNAALEVREGIVELIGDADMLFLTAGMGGGTGTGAMPVIAEIARELGILTIAVITQPYLFEGRRKQIAQEGIGVLSRHANSLIVVPHDKMVRVLGGEVTFDQAFRATNDVLHETVMGITEIITVAPSMIAVDFADVKTVMTRNGWSLAGAGKAAGADRARIAAARAFGSPLLKDIDVADADGVLINISASKSLFQLQELYDVMDVVKALAAESANVIAGTVYEDALGDDMRVTIIATGLGKAYAPLSAGGPSSKSSRPG